MICKHTSDVVRALYDIYDQQVHVMEHTSITKKVKIVNTKERLLKEKTPFTIVLTDGHVLDLTGPYYANQNDVNVLKSILK